MFLSSKYFIFADISDSDLVRCRAVVYNNVIIVCIVTLRIHALFLPIRNKILDQPVSEILASIRSTDLITFSVYVL